VVPDGASNCRRAVEILRERSDFLTVNSPMEFTICYCHNLARSVLWAIGLHGSAALSENKVARLLILKCKVIARKLSQSTKLASELANTQKNLGLNILKPKNLCVTRWGAIFMNLASLILMRKEVQLVMMKKGVSVKMYNAEADDMDEPSDEVDGSSLVPDEEEWRIIYELYAVLRVFHEATTALQGIAHPANSWFIIKSLFDMVSDNRRTWDVPTGAKMNEKNKRVITYCQVEGYDLSDTTRCFLRVVKDQFNQRFVQPGPPKSLLICMHLIPNLNRSNILSRNQIESMDLHVKTALRALEDPSNDEVIESPPHLQPPATISPQTPTNSFMDFSCYQAASDEQYDPTCIEDAVQIELDGFKNITKKEIGIPDPYLFWAKKSNIARFPLHHQLAMSYLSAVFHEATSERTFSDCGRFTTDLRRSLHSSRACAQVLVNSGETIQKLTPDAIWKFYESRNERSTRIVAEGEANGTIEDEEEGMCDSGD